MLKKYNQNLYYQSDHFYWWSVGRRDLVYRMVKKKTTDLKEISILEVGFGSGELLKLFQESGAKVYGIENSEDLIFKAKKQALSVRLARAEKLPFADNFFDFVFALDVLEHLEDDVKALKEIFRVIKKGGYCLAIVPAFNFLWSSRDERLGHKRRYTTKMLRAKFQRARLKVEKVSYYSFFYALPLMLWILFKKKFMKKSNIGTDVLVLPNSLNWLAIQLHKIENQLVFKINLPWGFSVFCLARKL